MRFLICKYETSTRMWDIKQRKFHPLYMWLIHSLEDLLKYLRGRTIERERNRETERERGKEVIHLLVHPLVHSLNTCKSQDWGQIQEINNQFQSPTCVTGTHILGLSSAFMYFPSTWGGSWIGNRGVRTWNDHVTLIIQAVSHLEWLVIICPLQI